MGVVINSGVLYDNVFIVFLDCKVSIKWLLNIHHK